MNNILPSDQTSANGINTAFGGNRYFRAENQESKFLGITHTPYTVLKPIGNGVVDVYNDMYWSNLGSKDEVPQIFVIEKELQYGVWATQLSNILTQGAVAIESLATNTMNATPWKTLNNAPSLDTFTQLYNAEQTGFYYNFPWLLKNGDGIRAIENQWSPIGGLNDILGGMGNSTKSADKGNILSSIVGAAVGVAVGSMTPGFGFEDTKQFSGTSQQSLTITFPLYNTLDLKSAFNHFSFVNLFSFQNLKTRTSLMSYIPPKLYEVDACSVGGVYMPAAYVSNFKVDSIGTTRRMSDWDSFGAKEILIPEAYRVTITFTDLLSQSSNVLAGALGGVKVKITNAPSLSEAAIGIGNKVTENYKDFGETVKNSF